MLTGEGICIGEVNTYEKLANQLNKYYLCMGKMACNAIDQCWNQRESTSIDCQKQMYNGVVACQVRIEFLLYISNLVLV